MGVRAGKCREAVVIHFYLFFLLHITLVTWLVEYDGGNKQKEFESKSCLWNPIHRVNIVQEVNSLEKKSFSFSSTRLRIWR